MRNKFATLTLVIAAALAVPSGLIADDTEEAWAAAGRVAGPAGAQAIAARNGPSRELDPWQKELLRPTFGDRVDTVRVVFSATMLNDICGMGKCMTFTGVEAAAQAFEGRIYVKDPHRQWDFHQVILLAHEMQHVKQCDDAGSMSECGSRYFRAYYRAGKVYKDTQPEVEASNVEETFAGSFKYAANTRPCGTYVAFRSRLNPKYMVAEWGGGRELRVDRDRRAQWETFRINRASCPASTPYIDRRKLYVDEPIHLSSYWGFYVTAEGGGGGEVNARRLASLSWETFKLKKVSGSTGNQIVAGDVVAIQTVNGTYLKAEGGGGSVLKSDATQIGDWEKWTIETFEWPP